MFRRGEPLSNIGRGQPVGAGCSRVNRGFVRACRAATDPADGLNVGIEGVRAHSVCVIAQQKPASSRAAATAMIVRRFARASKRVQTRCRRRCADQAIATAAAGCPPWRALSALPIAGRLR